MLSWTPWDRQKIEELATSIRSAATDWQAADVLELAQAANLLSSNPEPTPIEPDPDLIEPQPLPPEPA